MMFPVQAAQRAEAIAASNAAEVAKKVAHEQRMARYRASLVEDERAKVAAAKQREVDAEAERQHAAANAAASERATTAALERYADCTVRNRTPNGCYEDWRPTPEAQAMVDVMR
ncbi:hypothetical protein [Brevundimonas sp. SL161]|uniref:hypothetical protein n=1 Tax=Brevundimonas sp. SL161 TaxID=2804613 RepID=UPI003CEC6F01